jgi:hypothetical protein
MLKTTALLAAAFLAAPAAFAGDCSPKEAEAVGKTAADLVRARVESVTAVAGKEMMNLSACKSKGGGFEIKYKYNFMAADGYLWVEGEGTINGASGEIEVKRMADKLKDAAEAKNIVLAAR